MYFCIGIKKVKVNCWPKIAFYPLKWHFFNPLCLYGSGKTPDFWRNYSPQIFMLDEWMHYTIVYFVITYHHVDLHDIITKHYQPISIYYEEPNKKSWEISIQDSFQWHEIISIPSRYIKIRSSNFIYIIIWSKSDEKKRAKMHDHFGVLRDP